MRIQIFTKIEPIRLCHTPNVSIKFRPNPCTTFWDILHTNRQKGGKNITSFTFGDGGKKLKTRTALRRAHTFTRLNSLYFVTHWKAGFASIPETSSNWLVLLTYPTHPPSFVITCPLRFETSCYIHIVFWPISQRWRITYKWKKISYPDRHQNLTDSSFLHRQPVHQVSAESVHNVLRYRGFISVLDLSLNGEESFF